MPTEKAQRLTICLAGMMSLLPFLLFSRWFHQLYYFHDDWELLDGAARLGPVRWALQPFLGDSIIPVFKLLWLGSVHALDGSYYGLVVTLWLTHAAICILFGFLLARLGLPPAATLFSVLTFGLAWSNIETLGWSMQWCSQLSLLFFLVAWWLLLGILDGRRGVLLYALCLFASVLSSQRGISSPLVLAAFVLFSAAQQKLKIRLLVISLAPSIIMGPWILLLHGGALKPAASLAFAAYYFLLNPLYHLLSLPRKSVGLMALVVYGAVKLAVVLWAMRRSDARWRPALLALLSFDLANAAALGLGRFHLGLDTSVSWRYQYISLLTFAPFAGLLLARCKRGVQFAAFLIWIPVLVYPWKRHAPRWAAWRGVEIRSRVANAPGNARIDPSGIAAARARDLERLYHLH